MTYQVIQVVSKSPRRHAPLPAGCQAVRARCAMRCLPHVLPSLTVQILYTDFDLLGDLDFGPPPQPSCLATPKQLSAPLSMRANRPPQGSAQAKRPTIRLPSFQSAKRTLPDQPQRTPQQQNGTHSAASRAAAGSISADGGCAAGVVPTFIRAFKAPRIEPRLQHAGMPTSWLGLGNSGGASQPRSQADGGAAVADPAMAPAAQHNQPSMAGRQSSSSLPDWRTRGEKCWLAGVDIGSVLTDTSLAESGVTALESSLPSHTESPGGQPTLTPECSTPKAQASRSRPTGGCSAFE